MTDRETSVGRGPSEGGRRRWRSRAIRLVLILLAVMAVLAAAAWRLASASLPIVDGIRPLPGLSAAVIVERDGLGVPTVRGRSREDVARATGFLHAQERFFQMDMARRLPAGELSELVGSRALPVDRRLRVYRFRAVVRQALSRLAAGERRLLDAYVDGVNAGLAALGARPIEYLLLRTQPARWSAEDSLLAVAYMYYGLQQSAAARESLFGVMHETLPAPLLAFLSPQPDEWEAPIAGTPPASRPAMPSPEQVNLRAEAQTGNANASPYFGNAYASAYIGAAGWRGGGLDDEGMPGSNSWAVDGRHAAAGRALLANDMHLDTSVPNTWYRMSLEWPDAGVAGGTRRLTGVTLPGVPAVVVGSNGDVAWGFTNAGIEALDLVVLEPDDSKPGAYRTPTGPALAAVHEERLASKGGPDETFRVEETIWGPVLDTDFRGRRRALAWVALRPEGYNLALMQLETARTVEEALDVGARSGLPAQNLVVADARGRIGWTIAGAIPNRVGFDGTYPTSWADGTCRWDGLLPPASHPRVVDPPGGRIWTANNQVVFGLSPELYSPLGVDEGARARQIRDDLLTLPAPTERDMLRIQLDDRAIFFERWRNLLLDTLARAGAQSNAGRKEFYRLVSTTWTGRASADSVAYTLVTRWRRAVAEQVFEALTLPSRKAWPSFDWLRPLPGPLPITPAPTRIEAPLWRLVSERPQHLLSPRFHDWDEQLLAAVDGVTERAAEAGERLADLRWGTINNRIRHRLSGAVGPLAPWLDMEDLPLDGGANVPRQRTGVLAASERLAVSPGREERGLFQMPCGQSGHPLSPHYRDGHMAWVRGEPGPFLPGKTVHTLTLTAR